MFLDRLHCKQYGPGFTQACGGPGGSVVVDFLFIVTPIVGVCNCSMFCCTLLCVRSSIAIILMGKRELVDLLNLSYWCLVMVERLFLAVPQGCLRFVIVVFPDHTHLLFVKYLNLESLLEKSLKITSALKSTGKALKGLEKSLNSTIFCRNQHC